MSDSTAKTQTSETRVHPKVLLARKHLQVDLSDITPPLTVFDREQPKRGKLEFRAYCTRLTDPEIEL